MSDGHVIDWASMGAWDRYGHYCAAIYGGLWAYDGWDSVSGISDKHAENAYTIIQANVVASEIRDPGRALPKAIKASMIVVLMSYELVNVAYYVLVPWDKMSSNNAVAVVAATSIFGRPAGIVITVLVAVSCAGSITSNVFAIGRLTMAASQRRYFPAIFSKRGLPWHGHSREDGEATSKFDAPM